MQLLTLFVVALLAPVGSPAADSADVDARMRRLAPIEVDEVVWLARCIYSESDRAHEQRLVAWVVRNRVETGYRGRSYREVILEAKQFSAFNEPTPRRTRILNLTQNSTYGPWQSALGIALDVYQAPGSERPFPRTVRHFYSPISMRGGLRPDWAETGIELSSSRLGVDPFRFRFFNDVDEGEPIAARDEAPEEAVGTDDGDGFLFPLHRRSGRVARPVRPSVRRTRTP